jgi:hypothetical protein
MESLDEILDRMLSRYERYYVFDVISAEQYRMAVEMLGEIREELACAGF